MLSDLRWRLRTALAVLRRGPSAIQPSAVRWYKLPFGDDFEADIEELTTLGAFSSWTETIYTAVSGLLFIVTEMREGRPVYVRRGNAFVPVHTPKYD